MALNPIASRRRLLQSLLAGAAMLPAVGAEAGPAIGAKKISACDVFTGIDFTRAEERQIANVIDDQLDALRAIIAYDPANALAPAEVFDPRLPGWRPRPAFMPAARPTAPAAMPTSAEDIAFANIADQAAWLRDGTLSSQQLTEIYLRRIAEHDPLLRAFITVTAEAAMADAAEADRELAAGRDRGPLHGLPYGLKDLIDVAGVATSWGAQPYRGRIAEVDAHVVGRLRAAGAVLLGKTSLGALAYGDLWFDGQTRNPWHVAEGSSGSSAGSAAAVVAGLASFAIGTETMGSIISPANRCGASGLRPSFGRVGRGGAMALCWSLDKIGVLARSAADHGAVLAALNGHDISDPASIDLGFAPAADGADARGLKLGYDPRWFEAAPAIDRQVLDAASDVGLQLVEVALPDLPYQALAPVVAIESAAAFDELTTDNLDDQLRWQADAAWPNTWRAIRFMPAVAYVQMQRLRRQVMQGLATAMTGVDMLVHPNFAADLLLIGNHAGYPAVSLRVGFIEQPARSLFDAYIAPADWAKDAAVAAVPRNVSLTGHLFDEARLLAAASLLERALGAAQARPTAKPL
ncbi:MAG: amidase [Sphingomonadales bacterium]